MRIGKLNFCQSFLLGSILNIYLLWMLAPCGKNNMYLRIDFHMFMQYLTYMCVCAL